MNLNISSLTPIAMALLLNSHFVFAQMNFSPSTVKGAMNELFRMSQYRPVFKLTKQDINEPDSFPCMPFVQLLASTSDYEKTKVGVSFYPTTADKLLTSEQSTPELPAFDSVKFADQILVGGETTSLVTHSKNTPGKSQMGIKFNVYDMSKIEIRESSILRISTTLEDYPILKSRLDYLYQQEYNFKSGVFIDTLIRKGKGIVAQKGLKGNNHRVCEYTRL